MDTLESAVRRLVAALHNPESSRDDAQQAAEALLTAAHRAPVSAQNEALKLLLPGLDSPTPTRSGFAAIVGGSLVENGASADILAPSLLERLPFVLDMADRFADRLRAALPPQEPDAEEGSEEEDENVLYIDGRPVPGPIIEQAMEEAGEEGSAFQAIGFWCMPTIACLSISAEARRVARQRQPELLPLCRNLGDVGDGAGFLWKLLQVMDDEPLLVLYPDTQQGFECRISGISDNFQLHTLLADALIEAPATPAAPASGGLLGRLMGRSGGDAKPVSEPRLPGTRPNPRSVAVAKGEGPQELPEPTTGSWNLYQWYALDATGKLTNAIENSDVWVWNEGIPADIELFEGKRVLVLGKPAYERSWSTTRLFDSLKASVVVSETLKVEQVQGWLQRLASASAARKAVGE